MRRMPRVALSLSFLALLVSAALLAVRLGGQPQSTSLRRQLKVSTPPSGAHSQSVSLPPQSNPMVAPLFLQDGNFASFVTMVNDTQVDLTATLVVHAPDGSEVARQTFTLRGHDSQVVQLSDLLRGNASDVHFGSVTLIPQPSQSMMPILAQLSMVGLDKSRLVYLDSEFLMPAMAMMRTGKTMMINRLRGVAVGAVRAPTVALTNTSAARESVTVTCVDQARTETSPEVFVVPAFGTELVKACEKRDDPGATSAADARKHGRSVGIDLEYTGSPGDIVAFGYNSFESGSNLSGIEFHDLSTWSGKGSVWTGIPIGPTENLTAGPFQPKMALANFSNAALTAQVSLWETRGSDQPQEHTLTLQLPPRSTRTLDISGLAGSPEMRNSFVLTSSGEPGDVVASLVSSNESSGQLVQSLAKDLGEGENAGGHPWTLEQGVDSMLLLFNPTSVSVGSYVRIPAGSSVWGKGYMLGPGATLRLDLAQLVASQAKDDHGFRLPRDLKGGALSWLNSNPAQGFGRVVQTAPSRLLARNFSCGNYVVACGAVVTGPSCIANDGQVCLLGPAEAQMCNSYSPTQCSGTSDGTASGDSFSWSSGNPAIATVSGSSTSSSASFFGVYPGATYGLVSVTVGSCSGSTTGPIAVDPTITMSCSPTHLATGSTAPSATTKGACTTSVRPSGGSFAWKVNTGTVALSPNGSSASYTSASKSATYGDTVISVTYSVNSELGLASSSTITVHQPTALTVDSDNSGLSYLCSPVYALAHPGNGTCQTSTTETSYSAPMRQRKYSVLDQFSYKFESVGLSSVSVTESVPFTSTCTLTVPPRTADTTPFLDSYYMCSSCCLPGGPGCSAKTNPVQTILVNNLPVRTETISWSCTGTTLSP